MQDGNTASDVASAKGNTDVAAMITGIHNVVCLSECPSGVDCYAVLSRCAFGIKMKYAYRLCMKLVV